MKSKTMTACAFAALLTLALPAWAATEFEISEGVLYGYFGDDPSGAVTIPEGVREIADEVFSGCVDITSVSLPGTLRRIGENAFADCANLKTVAGGANLEQVGRGAFRETRFVCGDQYFDGFASEAEELAYWNGLKVAYVGNFAVGICGELASCWEDSSWDGNGNLVWRYTLQLKAGTTGVADYLFTNLPFTSLEMPDTVKYIGCGAFSNTEYLQQLNLSKGLVSIGTDAFVSSGWYWAGEYKDIYSENQAAAVGRISRDATDCIVSIELPSSVERIGDCAFADCGFTCHVSGLRHDIEIGDDIFAGTPYADNCWDLGGDWGFRIEDHMVNGLVHFDELKFDEPWMDEDGELSLPNGELVIPEGVWGISSYALECHAGFSTVSLPDSLRCIEYGAFWGCNDLKTVTGGANLEHVGDGAFGETRFVCGDQYFDGFGSDEEEAAYWNGLEIVYVGNFAVGRRGELAAAWKDGALFDENDNFIWRYDLRLKEGTTGVAEGLFMGVPITSLEMPDSLKYIGYGAFACNEYLQRLKLGKGLVSIGGCAFEGAGSYWAETYWDKYPVDCEYEWVSVGARPDPNDSSCIVSIDLPSTLKSVGNGAFCSCGYVYYINGIRNDLELEEGAFGGTPFADRHGCFEGNEHMQFKVEDGVVVGVQESWDWFFEDAWVKDGVLTIPEGITEIAPEALAGCDGMSYVTKVFLPSTLTQIGRQAFMECVNLRYVEGLGDDVVVGDDAFSGTAYLEGWEVPALVIEDGVVMYLDYDWGYEDGCIVDGTLTIPEGVVGIESGALAGLEIKSVVLPKSLKWIGDSAFECCESLKTVTGGENLEWTVSNAFNETPFLLGEKYFWGFDTDEERSAYYNGLELVYIGNFIVGARGGLKCAWDDQHYDADGNWTWTYELDIPEGTTGMADGIFEGLPITSVKIPGTVRRIRDYEFFCCPIRSLTLGDGVEEIGEWAFDGNELTFVDLPESVLFVGAGAFCSGTDGEGGENVVFHSPLTQFDSSAFPDWQRVDFSMEGYHLANWKVSLHGPETMPEDGYLPAELEGQTADPAKCGLYPADGQKAFDSSYEEGYEVVSGDSPWTNTWTWTYLLTPVVEANRYTIEFYANGGTGTMLPATLTYDQLKPLPSCKFTRAGYDFLGWALAPGGDVAFFDEEPVEKLLTEGTMKLYAVWERGSLWDPVIDANGGRRAAALDATNATVFNAYAYDADGNTMGLVDIKAAKAKGKKGQALKTSAVTITIQLLGQKKDTVKGTMIVAGGADNETGVFRGKTKSGQAVLLNFGSDGVSGKIGNYSVDGALNKFTAKDTASKAASARVLAKRQGAYSVAFKTAGGWNGLSLVVGSKGKTKVTGVLVDGSKVSATTQLMIGEDDVCSLVVVYSKKNVNLAFNLWLSDEEVGVSGLVDAIAGKVDALAGGAAFRVDSAALANVIGDSTYAAYFPDGVSVALNGKKFVVAGGAKAGKVTLDKEKTGVDAEKVGANPSALKLAYTAKTGAFKGSFKGYINANGKPKAVSVTVNGVLLDGVGYGSALVKKAGSVPIEIR